MRIGTRGSALALAQARLVAGLIAQAHPDVGEPEIVVVNVSGDRDAAAGDKSRWVAELEQALLAGDVDLAVHSAKDVPGEPVEGLELLGAPARERAEDVLIGVRSLEELPAGAHVGTSSVRRAAQLRAARADLRIVDMRGNVDTRLRKLAEMRVGTGDSGHGDLPSSSSLPLPSPSSSSSPPSPSSSQPPPLDAIVLAAAGLRRLGREREIGAPLDIARFVPAPGQGLLALQARDGDEHVRAAVEAILDKDATACLAAERALARELGASCNTPLGAHAVRSDCGCLVLRAWVGLPDGSAWVDDELMGGFYDPKELGVRVAQRLTAAGAGELLAQAEELAVERG